MSHASARLIVDLGALVTNWRTLRAQAPGAACAAVVKADAYGLGAHRVVPALYQAGCRSFFVAQLEEGLALRTALPADAQIQVLNGLIPGSEAECAAHGLIPVLNSLEQVAAWQAQARLAGTRLPAVLQSDSGMHRMGLPARDWERLAWSPRLLDGITPILLMSHLASGDDPEHPANRRQLAEFLRFRSRWPEVPASLANSAGIFLGPEYHFDLLRPGAALYGIAPRPGQSHPLRPVLRLQARLLQCRTVLAGERVGYHHTWCAARDSRIATLAVGYADGYPRDLSNRAEVSVGGITLPLVGRVSMDSVTVDVTGLPEALLRPGSWFDLIDAEQDINVLAQRAEASAYELLTGLGRRFEREWLDAPAEAPARSAAPARLAAPSRSESALQSA